MDLFDIFEANEWEYNNSNDSDKARYQDIEITVQKYFIYIQDLSDKNNEKEEIIKTLRFDTYNIFEITQKLSCIKRNQEKIINIYKYISAIPQCEEFNDHFYLQSNIKNRKNFQYHSKLFEKIRKYIFEDEYEIFLPNKWMIDTHNQFCKKDDPIPHRGNYTLIDSVRSIPFISIQRHTSMHHNLEIICKMDEIFENYQD